ncbi:MAG TPA: glycosyltransferase family 39 protein [Candidatus Limnocylindrales bacterium]|nr:glycosyltransferase family 39 protein [Candidatus Limnocylindrales bacterium]
MRWCSACGANNIVTSDYCVRCEARLMGAAETARVIPLGLVVPLLAALGLGLFRLADKSFWLDEALSVMFADTPASIWSAVWSVGEMNMVAYYVLLNVWMTLGDSETVARLLSVAFAVAAVPVVWAIGRRLLEPVAAGVAALLLAVHPLFIQYAQEARGYSLLVLVAAFSTLLLLRAIERPTRARWLLYGVVLGLSAYVHLFALFVAPAHALWIVLRRWSIGNPRLAMAAIGLSVAVAAPALSFMALWHAEQINWLPQAHVEHITAVLIGMLGGGPSERPHLRDLALPVGYLAVLAAGIALMLRVHRRRIDQSQALLFLFAWVVMPVVLSLAISILVRPLFLDRYLLVALPGLTLVAGAVIARLSVSLRAGAVVAMSLASVLWLLQGWHHGYEKEDWRSASAYVMAEASPDHAIAFHQPWAAQPLYYYVGQRDQWDMIPERVELPLAPEGAATAPDAGELATAVDGHTTLWLILSHNIGANGLDPRVEPLVESLQADLELVARREFDGNLQVLRFER